HPSLTTYLSPLSLHDALPICHDLQCIPEFRIHARHVLPADLRARTGSANNRRHRTLERIDSRFEPDDGVSYWTTMGTARGPKRNAASCHPGNSGKQRFLGADGPGSECMAVVRAAHCARAAG